MRARRTTRRERKDSGNRGRGPRHCWLFGGVLSAALLVAGCATAPPAAVAQEPEPPDDAAEECVCLDLDEIDRRDPVEARRIRAQVRRSLRAAEEARRHSRREIERARRQIERIRDMGPVLGGRARLGIEIRPDQPGRADAVGVRVQGVRPEGPAAEAGLQEEDVIVAVDGQALVEPLPDAEMEEDLDPDRSLPVQRLVRMLADREPGDTLRVTYLRDGEERAGSIELGSFDVLEDLPGLRAFRRGDRTPPVLPPGRFDAPGVPDVRAPAREPAASRLMRVSRRGPPAEIRVQTLGPDLGQYFGTDEGVLILEGVEDADLGLRPGDVVLAVGSRDVEDEEDFRRILRSYEEGEEIEFRIRREGRELTVTGAMP